MLLCFDLLWDAGQLINHEEDNLVSNIDVEEIINERQQREDHPYEAVPSQTGREITVADREAAETAPAASDSIRCHPSRSALPR
jgi:hypothetical protein